ncbi:MAG: isochorismatase [Candidatus Paceibacterota bacterium]|jgi:nicotinamidase-related amidase
MERIEKVDYLSAAGLGKTCQKMQGVKPASRDRIRIGLLIIDPQNTFCHPELAELLVPHAWEDNTRLMHFILDNIARITAIDVSLDTHSPMQIFHPIFWVDKDGNHPAPGTEITHENVVRGMWRINPEVGYRFSRTQKWLDDYALWYTSELEKREKKPLMIWTYHGILGSFGHALDSSVEYAIFVHEMARQTTRFTILKGTNPFTEYYSIVGPEVSKAHDGSVIDNFNFELIRRFLGYDTLIIAGQSRSHCAPESLNDIMNNAESADEFAPRSKLRIGNIYFLDDCSSSIPGFEKQTNEAFARFAARGLHIVKSTTPMEEWPNIELN